MVNLKNITVHKEKTYTFMPPSVAHLIGFALNAQEMVNWELHSAYSAKRKGWIPEDIEIPKVPLHVNQPDGHYVLRNREWVLISYLDSEELKAKFEEILEDDDLSKAYLKACGQDDLEKY